MIHNPRAFNAVSSVCRCASASSASIRVVRPEGRSRGCRGGGIGMMGLRNIFARSATAGIVAGGRTGLTNRERKGDEMDAQELFQEEAITEEFLEFGNIPPEERLDEDGKLCGLMYLIKKLGRPRGGIFGGSAHDIIYLGWDAESCEKLSRDDVLYLTRCGVIFDDESDCLAYFT
jgi:hypothetical protein